MSTHLEVSFARMCLQRNRLFTVPRSVTLKFACGSYPSQGLCTDRERSHAQAIQSAIVDALRGMHCQQGAEDQRAHTCWAWRFALRCLWPPHEPVWVLLPRVPGTLKMRQSTGWRSRGLRRWRHKGEGSTSTLRCGHVRSCGGPGSAGGGHAAADATGAHQIFM